MSKRDLQKEINDNLKFWAKALGIHKPKWEYTITWSTKDDGAYAECDAEPEYYKAAIGFNLDKMSAERCSRRQVEGIVIHELLHVLFSPYTVIANNMVGSRASEVLNKLEETLVTGIVQNSKWRGVNDISGR